MIAEGLLYTKENEWAKVEGQTATIGITDYAQEQLGEITFVEMPAIGKNVKQKDELAVVESSKAASDVYSPVTGKVTEVNSKLESNPELINNDCYGSGWICKVKITDERTMENLMDSKQYEEYLKGL
ncbi:MAG: glycine cleavage system protein GcvH [Planctomycetota bacterium]|nr:MAG: glycine cleavage system protein GcvH [Planctomycetota bacterium]